MPPPAECQKGELHHGKTGAGAVVSDGLANTHQRLEILQRANIPDCSKVEIKANSKQSLKKIIERRYQLWQGYSAKTGGYNRLTRTGQKEF